MEFFNKRSLITVSLIAICNLILLYFYKYFINGLSIEEFSLLKTGNILNLILTVFFLIVCYLNFTKNSFSKKKSVLILSYIYLSFLIFAIVLKIADFNYLPIYLFGYPFKKIFPLLLLLFNQLIQLYLFIFLFHNYFNCKKLFNVNSFVCLSVITAILLIFSFISTYNLKKNSVDSSKPYDIGIVFGAAVWSGNKPSPIFKGRIEKSFELLKKKIIKKIQLTGGNAPGEISEAKAALNYLKKNKKIKDKNILLEEHTTTTNEQIKFIKENLGGKKIIFISDNFHLKRILEMADFYNLKAIGISSDYKLSWKKLLFYRIRDSIGLLLFWLFGI